MEYVRIGEIVNTFGIHGELKIRSFSDFDDVRYAAGNTIYLKREDEYIARVIGSYRKHKGMVLVSFTNQTNINDVLHYVGCTVYISKDEREELEIGQYYYDELVGMDIIIDDECVGRVIEVMDMPASPVLRIQTGRKTVMIPFVEAFILDVNIEENRIKISPIEGLV